STIRNGLSFCGKRVFLSNSTIEMCNCNYTINGWDPFGTELINKGDCFETSKQPTLNLRLFTQFYELINQQQSWNKIYTMGNNIRFLGNTKMSTNELIINSQVISEISIEISSSLKLFENGNLRITKRSTLIFGDNLVINTNEILTPQIIDTNGYIQIEKGCSIKNQRAHVTVTTKYGQKINLISFQEIQNSSSCYFFDDLIGGKLLYIVENQPNKIVHTSCVYLGGDFGDYKNYKEKILHCPISSENTTIYIENNNIEQNCNFIGSFVQNTTILDFTKKISYVTKFKDEKTNILFVNDLSHNGENVTFSNTNVKWVLGKIYGFEKTTSDFPKSINKNIYLTLTYNENYLCRLIQIEQNNEKCFLCKNYTYLFNNKCYPISPNCTSVYTDKTNGICQQCETHNEAFKYECVQCPDHCLRCFMLHCILCENDYYEDENGLCKNVKLLNSKVVSYQIGRIFKCVSETFINFNMCLNCGDNCVSCKNESHCFICNSKSTLESGICRFKNTTLLTNNDNIINCADGSYLLFNECIPCSLKYGKMCSKCDVTNCFNCSGNGVINNDNICIPQNESNCIVSKNSHCQGCTNTSSYIKENGLCFENAPCIISNKNHSCVVCKNDSFYQQNKCISQTISNNYCMIYTQERDRCSRCQVGYFILDNKCINCPEYCSDCINYSTCLFCDK
ncbi:hypothetical protein EIN_093170, partial [Entamoeba invadens IP1]